MVYEVKRRRVIFYREPQGREPARDWIESLQDAVLIARVLQRIERAASGNLGDFRRLTKDLYELRLHTGPGLRIYFSLSSNGLILILLHGGDKSTQPRDIAKAKIYLEDHQNATRN